jgi:hypothetical protein
MKKLFLLLALVACGDSNVQVGGEVIVKHQIDLNMFDAYYRDYCESLYTSKSAVDKCVKDNMDALVKSFTENGLL